MRKFNYTSSYSDVIEIERQQRKNYRYTSKYLSFNLGDVTFEHLTFHRSEIAVSRMESRKERKGYHKVRSRRLFLDANTIGALAMIDKILHKGTKDRKNLIRW
jgi:hypothetical protein